MPFLEPSEAERLSFANITYDSKKSVWAWQKKLGFVKATLIEEKDDKTVVQTETGDVSKYDLSNNCKIIY